MTYQTEDEILSIVRAFESGTIKREEWRHAEHLTVAFYYAFHYDYKTALVKMRSGIFNLLTSFEVDLSKEMPYHETLTVFWMKTTADFKKSQSAVLQGCNQLIEHFDKNYPLQFYSRELLFSEQARASFVEADLPLIEKSTTV